MSCVSVGWYEFVSWFCITAVTCCDKSILEFVHSNEISHYTYTCKLVCLSDASNTTVAMKIERKKEK